MWRGKRSERLRIPVQVNVDPEMSQHIKRRAVRAMRPIGAEIIHLITVGLSHDPEETVYEHFLTHAHIMAPPRTAAPFYTRPQKAKEVA